MDRERPLNARGRRAAKHVGGRLSELGLTPDHAIISSSARTRETWKLMSPEFAVAPEPDFADAVYEASPGQLLEIARGAPRSATCLMLLGHNPTVGSLAHYLADGMIEARTGWRFLKFPTAAVAVFTVSASNWQELGPDTSQLERFLDPRSLNTLA